MKSFAPVNEKEFETAGLFIFGGLSFGIRLSPSLRGKATSFLTTRGNAGLLKCWAEIKEGHCAPKRENAASWGLCFGLRRCLIWGFLLNLMNSI